MSARDTWNELMAQRWRDYDDANSAQLATRLSNLKARKAAHRPAPSAAAAYETQACKDFVAMCENMKREAGLAMLAGDEATAERFLDLEIVGELHAGTDADIVKALRDNPFAEDITLWINSFGGCVLSAQRIWAALRYHNARKTSIVTGDCSSAAIMPLLACPVRMAHAGARFGLHSSSIAPGETDHALRAGASAAADRIERKFAGWAGVNVAKFETAVTQSLTLTAQEARGMNLIHTVIGEDDAPVADDYGDMEISQGARLRPGETCQLEDVIGVLSTSATMAIGLPRAYLGSALKAMARARS